MCGIVAVLDTERSWKHDVVAETLKLLKWNKNRWQEWYGISVVTESQKILSYKFTDLYDPEVYKTITNTKEKIIGAIWHAIYPTSGSNNASDDARQPYSVWERDDFAFAFNGNIANADDLAIELEWDSAMKFTRPVLDTQVLKEMILSEIGAWNTNTRSIQETIHNQIDWACNMVMMSKEWELTATKDRWGFRPLSFAMKDGLLYVSSEQRAIFKAKVDNADIHPVKTWRFIKYNPQSGQFNSNDRMDLDVPIDRAKCFLEPTYFSDAGSVLWWKTSVDHRYRFWQTLAEEDVWKFSREDTVVIYLPKSAEHCTLWYSDELDLKFFDAAIFRDPDFDKRSFIALNKEDRIDILKQKFIFHPELVEKIRWKKLVIMDDSVVRWTTLEYVIEIVKEYYQPSEIHVRIPSPPLIAPCYYAINLKHPKELIARRFFQDPSQPQDDELQTLAKHFWATSMNYLTKDAMIWSLQMQVSDMCMWCIDWDFPTPKWQQIYTIQLEEMQQELAAASS